VYRFMCHRSPAFNRRDRNTDLLRLFREALLLRVLHGRVPKR
jgi:hypothetical protein